MAELGEDAEQLWTVPELARFLRVPVSTVYKWRTTGDGPRGIRVGRYVRYLERDVAAWLAAHQDVT
jgi:predicted DNA-binding transcriptional regulator AlpA